MLISTKKYEQKNQIVKLFERKKDSIQQKSEENFNATTFLQICMNKQSMMNR